MSTKAGTEYLAAFRRLADDAPMVMPKGTPVTQNNVAREAGRSPSAFKKAEYPDEVAIVKAYIAALPKRKSPSTTYKLNASRAETKKSKSANEQIIQQRDIALSLLVQSQETILKLRKEIMKLKELVPSNVLEIHFGSPVRPNNF